MNAAPGVPLRPLGVLTLAVLALHALALWVTPSRVLPVLHPAPLAVRTIEPPASAPATAALAPAPPEAVTPALASAPAFRTRRPDAASPRAPARQEVASAAADALATVQLQGPEAEAPAASSFTSLPVSATPMPVVLPAPARWRYAVTARRRGLAVAGEAQLDWRHDGRSYEAVLQVSAPPLPARIQRSTGDLGPEGLAPLRFSERLRGEQAAHFDRVRGRIVFSGNQPEAALPAGAQDRLSVLLQLAALVAGDPARFVPGATVTLATVTTRETGDGPFRVEGREELALPAGPITTLKLVRPPRHEYDVRLEVWLVPGRDYGPVRLRLTAPNGDWLDLQGSGTDKG